MAEKLAAHLQRERRTPPVHTTHEQPSLAVKPQGIVGLQRYVGNQGVQRLLAQGLMQMKPEVQRCSACKGTDEEAVQLAIGNLLFPPRTPIDAQRRVIER